MTDSTSTADFVPEIPQDLIDDVLLLLPARSIGRFRCVSKLWKSLLSSPKFIKSHFNFHLHRTTPIAVVSDGDGHYIHKHLITFPADGSDGPSRKVTFPFLGKDDGMRVKAACHGFVLVVVQVADIWRVLNPLTFESYELPGFSVPLNDLPTFYDMFGMGYDSCSDDYKIVQITKSAWTDGHVQTMSVGVYSLKRKCWTKVWNCPYSPVAKFDGTYTNGFLHWVAKAWEDHDVGDPNLVVIAAFNLALEIFEEVPLPKGLPNCLILCVTVLRECLAIVCRRIMGCVNVWLMRDYGVQESWHKLVINTEDMYVTTVLSLSREDEFVLIVDSDSPGRDREDRLIAGDREDRLIAYSSRTGFRRYIVYDDLPCNMLTTVSISAECLLPSSCISAE